MSWKRITGIISGVTIGLVMAGGVAGAAPNSVHVSPNNCSPSGPGTNSSPYCTVQEGVNAVVANGTVFIGPGTYNEQITLTKTGVTLDGAGTATVIKAPASLTSGNIVDINASNVTLKDLTISGPFNSNNCGSTEYGVFFENGSSGSIRNSKVVSIREANQPNFGGCQQGVAIRVGSAALGIHATATLMNDKVSDYQKAGIVIDGPGSNATIRNNDVDGLAPSSIIARNGIQVGRGASAIIRANTISNNSYTGSSATATGILIFSEGLNLTQNLTVSQNVADHNDVGLDVDSQNSSFSQNTTDSNTANGIFVEPTASQNTFRQNEASNNTGNANFTPFDMEDDSTGGGTLGTANNWHLNGCTTSKPAGLCKQ